MIEANVNFYILVAIITVNSIATNTRISDSESKIMAALIKNRAIESEGRCYRLEIPKGFNDE